MMAKGRLIGIPRPRSVVCVGSKSAVATRVHDEGPSRKDCLPEKQRNNTTMKYIAFIHCIDFNRTHVKDEGNRTLLLYRNISG